MESRGEGELDGVMEFDDNPGIIRVYGLIFYKNYINCDPSLELPQ